MSMQAESLEVLEKASVAPTQARAIVRAIEIEIAGAKDTLATKQDVLGLHQALDVLRAELRGEMTGHRPRSFVAKLPRSEPRFGSRWRSRSAISEQKCTAAWAASRAKCTWRSWARRQSCSASSTSSSPN